MRVADLVAQRLAWHGVRHVFGVTGGGAMHLNDAFGRNPDLACIYQHHEQACAYAAEGYQRATGRLPAVNVTTGPGGTNAISGVLGQWTDSIPVIYVSGQVKFPTTVASCPELGLRQLGDQEVDIVPVVRPLTKLAERLLDPRDAFALVDRAIHVATHGRPGPVWIDVPIDVQAALVDPATLHRWTPDDTPAFDEAEALAGVERTLERLLTAERPVVVAGHGIRIAGAMDSLFQLLDVLRVPVLSTFNGFDLIPSSHPAFVGRIGTIGDRAGNFALQNADVALMIGTRNNIRQVSYGWQTFARAATKIVVDIDPAELRKPTLRPDLAVHADAGFFLRALVEHARQATLPSWDGWLAWGLERRRRYPVVLPEYLAAPRLNPYVFVQRLTRALGEGDVLVSANGTASIALFQAAEVKRGQRLLCNSGCAAMGFDLPGAIGACVGTGRRTVCLAGDGSLQMNLQELQTVVHHQLPVKIFVVDNDGYVSIRQTQKGFFGEPLFGCDPASGTSLPDLVRIADAYGIPATTLSGLDGMDDAIAAVLASDGPALCRVVVDRDAGFAPKLSSARLPDGRMVSKPLEDLSPLLDRDEFRSNMIIPVLPEE